MFHHIHVEQFVTDRIRERRAAAAAYRTARRARRAVPAGRCGATRPATVPATVQVTAPAVVPAGKPVAAG